LPAYGRLAVGEVPAFDEKLIDWLDVDAPLSGVFWPCPRTAIIA
jgi:hypothetical protein